MTQSANDYQRQYTKPELRESLKEKIKQSDKGGKSGQWSARKSQLLTQEYEKQGGDYKGDKTKNQKNLETWQKEEWQTKDGKAQARNNDRTERYLPKKAWESMSEGEKTATNAKKVSGSKAGKQHVPNTKQAQKARKQSSSS